jgi:hypothetical protein
MFTTDLSFHRFDVVESYPLVTAVRVRAHAVSRVLNNGPLFGGKLTTDLCAHEK